MALAAYPHRRTGAAEPRYEYTRSALTILQAGDTAAFDNLGQIFDALQAEAAAQLDSDAVPATAHRFTRIAECRYVGQGFELRVEVPEGPFTAETAAAVAKAFFSVHRTEYGHAFEDQAVELVTLRVIGTARADTLRLPPLPKGGRRNPAEAALYARPTTFDDGETLDTPRFDRGKLKADDSITGPAIIVQQNSTTVIPRGYTSIVMALGDIVISRNAEGN